MVNRRPRPGNKRFQPGLALFGTRYEQLVAAKIWDVRDGQAVNVFRGADLFGGRQQVVLMGGGDFFPGFAKGGKDGVRVAIGL